MKRIAVIILMFLYLIPAIGVTVSAHYCGGKISSLSLKFADTHKCACGNKAMKKDCCKDETKTFKLKDSHQFSTSYLIDDNKQIDFQTALAALLIFPDYVEFISTDFYGKNHPPDNIKLPLYIQNRVFRI